jgi:CRP/FNR family cyclic AMP-dependent transcriptional regulator
MKINLFNRDTETETHPAGTTLFLEGDPGTEMFAVVEGAVDLVVRGRKVETVGPGGVFGEMALVEKLPRIATAVVSADAKVVRVDERRFLFLVQQSPFFALQIMAVMAERIRRMDEKL